MLIRLKSLIVQDVRHQDHVVGSPELVPIEITGSNAILDSKPASFTVLSVNSNVAGKSKTVAVNSGYT